MERHEPPIPNVIGGKEAAQAASVSGKLNQLERQAQSSAYLGSSYRSTAQTLETGFNLVKVNEVALGVSGLFSSNKYVAPIPGLYYVTGHVAASYGSGVSILISLYKNGSETLRGTRLITAAAGLHDLVVAGVISAAAGDTIELYTYTSGGGEALEISSAENRLTAFRVG